MNLQDALGQALQLHQSGNRAAAKAAYQSILETTPGNPFALHFLGLLTFQEGDSENAVRLIRNAIRAMPEYVEAHNNLGNILNGLGLLSESESAYRTAIALNPDDPNPHSNLCIVLKKQGRNEEAVTAGERAASLAPEHAHTWLNLANAQRRAGRDKQALASYRNAIRLEPDLHEALEKYNHLQDLLEQRGEIPEIPAKEQIAAYRKLLKSDPDHPIAGHMLAALTAAAVPDRASDAFVRSMFDQMADGFEDHLEALDYRVPQLLESRLGALFSDSARAERTLDAGCGTGLLGKTLRSISGHLTGVDLSSGMLGKARDTGFYDQLEDTELTAFLAARQAHYDLIVCADTLCYFGDLREILGTFAQAMRPGAYLVFTVEQSRDGESPEGFRLHSHGRYSHDESHVQDGLREAGLRNSKIERVQLRTEFGDPVQGMIVTASKTK